MNIFQGIINLNNFLLTWNLNRGKMNQQDQIDAQQYLYNNGKSLDRDIVESLTLIMGRNDALNLIQQWGNLRRKPCKHLHTSKRKF